MNLDIKLRILDFIFAMAGLIIASPIMLIVLIAGFSVNGSPIFAQRRVGKNRSLFTLYKFRTMAKNTVSVASHLVDSGSVTRFGHILRKTKLDELPQLVNVLMGHMSLVGPRPCLANQTELVEERENRGVFSVRPGISGVAQINDIDMSTPRKLARYDKLMIDNLNIRLYLKIILLTALGRGRGDRIRSTKPGLV